MTMLSSNNHRSISALLKLTSVVRYLNRGLKNEIRISQSDPVSTHEVKNYLSEHGLPYKTGHACITTICPKFRKSKLKLKEVDQLFINSTSGYFVCRSCQKSGPWGKLKDNIGALAYGNIKNAAKVVCFEKWNEVEPIKQESESVSKLLAECSEPSTYDEDSLLKILEEYGFEEISTETLQSFGVRFLPDGEGIVLPACDAEVNFVMAKTLTKNETSGKLKTKTIPRRDYVGLFGMNLTKDKHNIVICGSEADAMAVYQSTGVPAVSLPRGITTLPQEVLPYLESFRKITIWFDNSILSFANAKLFAKKLGVNRTQVIRPERDCPGPHEALKSKLKLKKILAKAASIQHTHIISFSDLRDDVKNELTCSAEVAGVRWKNFNRLNDILKGHRRSELTVFTGGTGTGKTTFMSDYSLDLCTSGVNTLWGSFEINNVRLMKMMLQQYSRKDLAKHIDEYDQIADQFEALPMYFMNFHGQERIKKVIETMSHAVYVYDISHVIVDNLQFMMGAGDSHMDKFTKQDQIIAAFRTFATNMQCHVSLVIHPRKENEEMLTTNSIFGSAKASQEADNIIILQAMKVNGIRKKYLQVTKNRFDGTLGNMGLRFDKESKSFSVLPQQRELTGQSHLSSSDPPRILTSTHDNRPCEHDEACGNDSFTW